MGLESGHALKIMSQKIIIYIAKLYYIIIDILYYKKLTMFQAAVMDLIFFENKIKKT